MIQIFGDSWITCAAPGKPYVNGYNSGMNVGQVRYNTSSQCLEAYDGSVWVPLTHGSATISMSSRATEVLNWAEKQMLNEISLEEKAKESPAIADAFVKYKEASAQLKVILTLADK